MVVKKKTARAKGATQAKASTAVSLVRQPFNRDLQNLDTSGNVSTSNVSFSYVNLFAPVQGTSNSSRYGNKTLAYSLRYAFFVDPGAAVPMRILIIYDKQPNTAFPSTPQPLTNLDTTAFPDPDLRMRFQILRDLWIGNSGANTTTSNDPNHTNLQRGLLKFRLPSEFTSNSGTISSVQTGSFVLVVYNGGTNAAALIFRTRILYES